MTHLITREALQKQQMFFETLQHSRLAFCITDPTLEDNPIKYANPAFFKLTGYSEDEIVGRNCRFLQGPDTSEASIKLIRQAIIDQTVQTIDIVNYRKSGEKFVSALQIGPIFDDDGSLTGFFGSQLDVTEERETAERARQLADSELAHRLGSIVNVLTALVRLSKNDATDVDALITLLSERIRAVGNAHILALKPNQAGPAHLGDIAHVILSAYAPGVDQRLQIEGPPVNLPEPILAPLSLTLHELATNAVKHGALSKADGSVSVSWQVLPSGARDQLALRWAEAGGPRVHKPPALSGFGMTADLLKMTGGAITYDWCPTGMVATVTLPI